MKSSQINGYLLWKNGGKTNELGIAGTIIYPFGRKKIHTSFTHSAKINSKQINE